MMLREKTRTARCSEPQTRTKYTYDALNRLTQKTYSDSTPKAVFNYDETAPWGWTLSNPVGRLTTTSTKNSSGGTITASLLSYDPLGRVAVREQCQPLNCGPAPSLALTYAYNLLGEPTSMRASQTNVFDFTLSYSYNSTAHLATISSSLSDANHPVTLFSGASYNAPAQLTTGLLGGIVREHRSYNSRLWPTSVTVDSSVYSYSMSSYAPNGDVLGVNDSVNGNWVYKYDDFNRLICSNLSSNGTCAAPTSGTATYTYKYDRFGNRWQQNGPNSMQLSFSGNNNRMDGYSYDAAGNLTNDGNYVYTYDAENRIIQVNLPGGALVATYMYDANGNRVSKTSGGVSRGYLYDTEAHVVSETNLTSPATWTRGEIFAAGRHIATYANGTTYFIETDWLGTERVRTNVSGTSCETITSLPFGDGQTTSGSCGDPTPLHFTGKERDSESGLDDFEARYYSSSIGRFMRPDPQNAGASPEEPQSWNAYAYAGNNPLNSTDPDGLNYLVCENGGKNCADLSDKQYEKFRKDNPNIYSYGGNLYIINPNGTETKTGTVTYYNEKDADAAAHIAASQLLIIEFVKQVAINVAIGAIGRGIGLGIEAIQAARAANAAAEATEVANLVAKAAGTVGNQGATASSKAVALAAAEDWVGQGARPIVDRTTGQVVGKISASGDKVYRITSINKAQPYVNLVNKTTGGNLHVRF